jgi:hypothetical protein
MMPPMIVKARLIPKTELVSLGAFTLAGFFG